jgi:hypothetical protein
MLCFPFEIKGELFDQKESELISPRVHKGCVGKPHYFSFWNSKTPLILPPVLPLFA